MKRFPLLLLFAVASVVNQANAFIYETAAEFQGTGDFDGNGLNDLIIVDKATGNYRIAYQLAPGAYTWVSARASGIGSPAGLGIGRLDSLTNDSLAFAGPDDNRVNILEANSTMTAGLPASVFIRLSLGPNLVGVTAIGGGTETAYQDLYIASRYNGVTPYRETLVRNDGTTNRTMLADNPLSFLRERANLVLIQTNRAARLALFERAITNDMFDLLDLSSGSAVDLASILILNTPSPCEYVTAQFVTTNAYTQFVLYPPGGWYAFEYQVTEPAAGNYALIYTNQFVFTNFLDRIFTLPGTNGTKLLVLYSNDQSAAVFAFDGVNPPALVQQFNADAGEHLTGAGVLGNSGFMAYSAPLGQSSSSKFKQWDWTGTAYTNSRSGSLPSVSAYTASGNVMQFQFEPFVTNNPILLRINNAGDWSDVPLLSSGNISTKSETFLNSTQGLVNPTTVALGTAHPQAQFALGNQYSNMISLFSFTAPAGDKVSDVAISPSPGA